MTIDKFPPLSVQIFWLSFFSILSWVAVVIIRRKKLLEIPHTKIVTISLKDVLINFGFYIALSFAIVPVVFFLLKDTYLKSPVETISLFQMFFMTLISSFIICYLNFRKIHLIKAPDNWLQAMGKVLLYLAVIFPIVSLIGQLCDTTLYLFFNVEGYEQLAVTFLKRTLSNPLALTGSILSITILAPLSEELLFRGILLNFFQNRFGSWPAVILSGLLFAVFHYSNSQGLGNISLLFALSFFGIMLGSFYLMTASLIYPIMLHAVFNLLSSMRILFIEA